MVRAAVRAARMARLLDLAGNVAPGAAAGTAGLGVPARPPTFLQNDLFDLFGQCRHPNVTVEGEAAILWNASLEILDSSGRGLPIPSRMIQFGYGTPPGGSRALPRHRLRVDPCAGSALAPRCRGIARRIGRPRDRAPDRGCDPSPRAPSRASATATSDAFTPRASHTNTTPGRSCPRFRFMTKDRAPCPATDPASWNQMASRMGRGRHLRRAAVGRQAQVLRAGDVPVSLGPHPHRACAQLHDGRRDLRATSWPAASTCCTRWASTPSACRPRMPRMASGGHPADWTYANIGHDGRAV